MGKTHFLLHPPPPTATWATWQYPDAKRIILQKDELSLKDLLCWKKKKKKPGSITLYIVLPFRVNYTFLSLFFFYKKKIQQESSSKKGEWAHPRLPQKSLSFYTVQYYPPAWCTWKTTLIGWEEKEPKEHREERGEERTSLTGLSIHSCGGEGGEWGKNVTDRQLNNYNSPFSYLITLKIIKIIKKTPSSLKGEKDT